MACLNSTNLIYLQTYNPREPQKIKINSSVGSQIKTSENIDFFYIQFSDKESFRMFPITDVVPEDVLNKIRNRDAFLVLDNALEYFTDTVESIYRNVILRYDIPAEQVIFQSAVPTMIKTVERIAEKYGAPQLKLDYFNCFEATGIDTIHTNKNIIGITKTKKWPKKFLCLNRRWRSHRPLMMLMLYERNLLDKGHISFGKSDRGDNWRNSFRELRNIYKDNKFINDLIERNKDIVDLPDLYLDTTDLVTNRAQYESSIVKYYKETYFSVVNETTYHEGIPFFSEKIFKVMAIGHPFILSTVANSLPLLRDLGYKTFHPFIDETYDTVQDDSLRMTAIVDEIERLCSLDKIQTLEFIANVRPILEHNYNVLVSKKSKWNISRKVNY
jgi:hypothetical protein